MKSIFPTVATDHQSVKREETRVTWNPIENPRQQVAMDNVSEITLICRHIQQAYVGYRLDQKVKDKGLAEVGRPEFIPKNPANSNVLKLRKTSSRNEVTVMVFSIASYGVGINRKPITVGLPKKQRPLGKPEDRLT